MRRFFMAAIAGLALVLTAGRGGLRGEEVKTTSFHGFVNGIDVGGTPWHFSGSSEPKFIGLIKCWAFISRDKPGGKPEIHVVTTEPRLQTALELAAAKGVQVIVDYYEVKGENRISRVRLLDRPNIQKPTH